MSAVHRLTFAISICGALANGRGRPDGTTFSNESADAEYSVKVEVLKERFAPTGTQAGGRRNDYGHPFAWPPVGPAAPSCDEQK